MSYPYAKSHLAFVAKLCNDRCFWDEKLWSTNDEFFGRCEWMCFVFGECKCSTDKHFSITLMAYRILYLSPKVLSHISTENLYSSKERRRARDAWLTPSNHPSTQPSQNRDSDSFLLLFFTLTLRFWLSKMNASYALEIFISATCLPLTLFRRVFFYTVIKSTRKLSKKWHWDEDSVRFEHSFRRMTLVRFRL